MQLHSQTVTVCNMPHTTTKTLRTKRVDTRPNGKERKKLNQKVEESKTIQDIRVTKVQRNEKKERLAQPSELITLSKNEKILRALKKKLRSIDDLLEKQKNGVELDEQQLAKIETLDSVMEQMESLLSKSRGAVDSD